MTPLRLVCLILALACGGCGTLIRVTLGGALVPGAEVYADGKSVGKTGSGGTLQVPGLTSASRLSARVLLQELPSYRQNHGPENNGQGWITRSYVTSLAVDNDGKLAPEQPVGDPGQTQEIKVSSRNALIGLHMLVSVQWDAADTELAQLAGTLTAANQYLYNATDGQFFFEQIDIADEGAFWQDAELLVPVDNNTWPHSDHGGYLGRFLGLFQTAMYITPLRVDGQSDYSTFYTYVHEFGHLGFGLWDEYIGFDNSRPLITCPGSNQAPNHCSVNATCDDHTIFAHNGAKASCVMYDQSVLSKFCSHHPDNPHKTLTLAGFDSCWNLIVSTYGDKSGRWLITDPVMRNAIPGPLPPIPTQWATRINKTNVDEPNLCAPVSISLWSGNGPAVNTPVVLQTTGGRSLAQGFTDGMGQIKVYGVHVGDRIVAPTEVWDVGPGCALALQGGNQSPDACKGKVGQALICCHKPNLSFCTGQ